MPVGRARPAARGTARSSSARRSSSPAPVLRRDRDDGRVGEEAAAQVRRAPPRATSVEPLGVDQVRLGQRDHPAPDAEQLADVEVLAGLRHDALVGGDDQADQVEAAGAGHHRLDEALVARHVDHAEAPVAEVEVGEAELGGDAALLLLLEAIGVDAGQRLTSAVLPWSMWPAVPRTIG